jgi:hypothetical protein
MVKIKVVAYWTDIFDKEREDTFYVDKFDENAKKLIYDRIRTYFTEDIPTDEELEKNYDLYIEVKGPVLLCDLCGWETEKLFTISLVEIPKNYGVCKECFELVQIGLEFFKKKILQCNPDILGNK